MDAIVDIGLRNVFMQDDSRESRCCQRCLSRWLDDERCSCTADKDELYDYPQQVDSWFSSLPGIMQDDALSLLDAFDYYTHTRANQKLRELYIELQNRGYINDDESFFITPLPRSNGSYGSSHRYTSEFQLVNSINPNHILVTPNDDDFVLAERVIFIDDFCGSGCSLKKYLSEICSNRTAFFNIKVVYAVIHAMEQGVEAITEFGLRNYIDIDVVYLESSRRAISDLEDESERQRMLGSITEGSNALGISEDYIRGFKGVEALVAFYNNTPNNTLGFFWQEPSGSTYKPLFPRKRRGMTPLQRMKDKNKRQAKENYAYRRSSN